MNRAVRLLLEVAGAVVGGTLVLALLAAWRLSVAPVDASFIGPYLEQEINAADLGVTVSVSDAKVAWHRFRPVLDLKVRGLKVLGEGGAPIASVADATLGISLRGLLVGRVLPTEIDVDHPEIAVIRDPAGRFALKIGGGESGDFDSDPGALLDRLAGPANDRDLVGRLHRVHLIDGRMIIDDQKLGVAWSVPDIDLDMRRNAAETVLRIGASIDLPARSTRLTGDVRLGHADGKMRVALNLADLDAAALAPLSPLLAPLARLAFPLSGDVRAVIDRDGRIVSGDADLRGAAGGLVLPEFYPAPLAIRSAALAAHLAGTPQRLTIDRLSVDLGDARVQASGTADLNGPAVTIDATAQIHDLPLARFDALWPHGVAVGGRDWVVGHIPSGVIRSGTVHVAAAGRLDDPGTIQPNVVEGAFDYTGLEVHYLPPLPPVRAIAGQATFDQRRMDLTIQSGRLGQSGRPGDIAVSDGTLAITGFDQDDRAMAIGLKVDGPLPAALAVLDTKPLFYARQLGIDPGAADGHMDLRANFAFPLIRTLPFAEVALGAKGKLDHVAVAGAVGGRDVTDGTLDLVLEKTGMVLTGDARLSGVPVGLAWTESFRDAEPIRSRIGFHAVLDDAGRAALRLAPGSLVRLEGAVPVTGQVTIDRSRNIGLDVRADLAAAALGIDMLGLRKPQGVAGSAGATLEFAGDTLRRIPRFSIDSKPLQLAGAASFAADGSLLKVQFPRIASDRNDYGLTAETEPGAAAAYAVSVTGSRFDAAPLLDARSRGPSGTDEGGTRIDATIALDHLLTGTDRALDAIKGSLSLTGDRLDRADLAAAAGAPVTLTYLPEGGQIALHFAAADAGGALAGLGITGGVRGGTLHIDGKTTGGNGPRITTATLDMQDFRLTKAPIIARLVNALSLTGFVDLLEGRGLQFDRLTAQVDYADRRLTFRDGRCTGALGLSFEGNLDFARNRIALKGTVVPVDTLNRILAAIPVIGDIVTGGDRGGLLGWTYSVGGTPEDPRVSVNPLSVFAPGFLRNLFFLGPTQPAPKAAPDLPDRRAGRAPGPAATPN
jgi:hypothetical protein